MFISFIMPVYNVAPYLRDSLDSLIAQTFGDWECICVDDGSTDGSGSMLDEYARKDKRIRVVHQTNAGPGPARNAGMKLANGKWVGFLDGDDVISPFYVEALHDASLRCLDTDAIEFKMCKFEEVLPKWNDVRGKYELETRDISQVLTQRCIDGGFSEKIYVKAQIDDIEFPPFRPGQDRAWLASVMAKINYLSFTNMVVYGYRQRAGSTMHSRMSFNMLKSRLDWKVYTLDTWNTTHKIVETKMKEDVVQALSEHFSWSLHSSVGNELQEQIWPYWMDRLTYVYSHKYCVTLWQKITYWIVVKTQNKLCVWTLFTLPFRLRMLKGAIWRLFHKA